MEMNIFVEKDMQPSTCKQLAMRMSALHQLIAAGQDLFIFEEHP